MHVIRAGNINEINVFPRNQLAPVSLVRLETPAVGESLHFGRVARAGRLEHRLVLKLEKITDFAIGVRMGAAHEAVTDEADVEGLHGILWLVTGVQRSTNGHRL